MNTNKKKESPPVVAPEGSKGSGQSPQKGGNSPTPPDVNDILLAMLRRPGRYGRVEKTAKHRGHPATVLVVLPDEANAVLAGIIALAANPLFAQSKKSIAVLLEWARWSHIERHERQEWQGWRFISPRNWDNCDRLDIVKEAKEKHVRAYPFACIPCPKKGTCRYLQQFKGPPGFAVYPAHFATHSYVRDATLVALSGDGPTIEWSYTVSEIQEAAEAREYKLYREPLRTLAEAARRSPEQVSHMTGSVPRQSLIHSVGLWPPTAGVPLAEMPPNFEPLLNALRGRTGWALRSWGGKVIAYQTIPLTKEEALRIVKKPVVLLGPTPRLLAAFAATGARMVPLLDALEAAAEGLWAEDSPVTQRSVGRLTGVSQQTISREWEGLKQATGARVEVKARGLQVLIPHPQLPTPDIKTGVLHLSSTLRTFISTMSNWRTWPAFSPRYGVDILEIKRPVKGSKRPSLPLWAIPWPAQTFDSESGRNEIRVHVLTRSGAP